MAEFILNHWGKGRFKGGVVCPMALELLRQMSLPTEGLRSKGWEGFAAAGTPERDYVLTVCDNAAGETCPIWPGHPITAHRGVPDPAAIDGSDATRMLAFRDSFRMLERRIQLFLALRHRELSRGETERKVVKIGRLRDDVGQDKAS